MYTAQTLDPRSIRKLLQIHKQEALLTSLLIYLHHWASWSPPCHQRGLLLSTPEANKQVSLRLVQSELFPVFGVHWDVTLLYRNLIPSQHRPYAAAILISLSDSSEASEVQYYLVLVVLCFIKVRFLFLFQRLRNQTYGFW